MREHRSWHPLIFKIDDQVAYYFRGTRCFLDWYPIELQADDPRHEPYLHIWMTTSPLVDKESIRRARERMFLQWWDMTMRIFNPPIQWVLFDGPLPPMWSHDEQTPYSAP